MKRKFLLSMLMLIMVMPTTSGMRNQDNDNFTDIPNIISNSNTEFSKNNLRLIGILWCQSKSVMRSVYNFDYRPAYYDADTFFRLAREARLSIVNRPELVDYRPDIDWFYAFPNEFESIDKLKQHIRISPNCDFCCAMINENFNFRNISAYSNWCDYHKLWVNAIADILYDSINNSINEQNNLIQQPDGVSENSSSTKQNSSQQQVDENSSNNSNAEQNGTLQQIDKNLSNLLNKNSMNDNSNVSQMSLVQIDDDEFMFKEEFDKMENHNWQEAFSGVFSNPTPVDSDLNSEEKIYFNEKYKNKEIGALLKDLPDSFKKEIRNIEDNKKILRNGKKFG